MFFIFDSPLGNRVGQLEILSNWSFFPSEKFEFIEKIVYLSILKTFGFF